MHVRLGIIRQGKVDPVHVMKKYVEVEVWLREFLISALDEN